MSRQRGEGVCAQLGLEAGQVELAHTLLKENGITMANVELRPGESQEQLLKRFRKEVTKSRVLSTARKKRWFTPPSEVRRIKKQKAIRKARQAQRKRERTDY